MRLAKDAQSLELSYKEVGISQSSSSPCTFRRDHCAIELDDDEGSFDRARQALRRWQAHIGAGARIAPVDPPIEVGQVVVVAMKFPGFTAIAPCRIVWVVDEHDRFGFAYGTLEGHPERGEESFVISRVGARVTFEINAASRPAALLSRLGAPVARSIQKNITQRYLNSLKHASASGSVRAGRTTSSTQYD